MAGCGARRAERVPGALPAGRSDPSCPDSDTRGSRARSAGLHAGPGDPSQGAGAAPGGLCRHRAGGAASAAPLVPRRRNGTDAGSLEVQIGQARYSVREAQGFLRLRAAAAAPSRPGGPQPRCRPAPAG